MYRFVFPLMLLASPTMAAQPSQPLRSFTAPPGQDDDRPRPQPAPRGGVETRLLAPPGTGPAPDVAFAFACSAEEAAMTDVTAGPRVPACPGSVYTVVEERP